MKYQMDQVSIRMVRDPPLISEKPITGPESAVEIISEFLCDFDREVVVIVNLRNDGKPINMNVMSMGTINASIMVPREALKASILSNASNVLLAHNHPSGNLVPSQDDIKVTDMMIRAYDLLGMSVLDHIIVGPDKQFFSMREREKFGPGTIQYASVLEKLEFKKPKTKEKER
ncbi:MAG: JAB domain-containing protein [Firmicutes bacterium]|nr:JAB domain-containing protein [Bacillota bacterium]